MDAADLTFDQQLANEAELQRACVTTHDHLEGVSAFLQKRQPDCKVR